MWLNTPASALAKTINLYTDGHMDGWTDILTERQADSNIAEYNNTAGDSEEQDQTARICRLILVYTLRKMNAWSHTAAWGFIYCLTYLIKIWRKSSRPSIRGFLSQLILLDVSFDTDINEISERSILPMFQIVVDGYSYTY